MAEEFADANDFYIFSKDRQNHSIGNVISRECITPSVIADDYVNVYEQRRIENEYLTQKSLPNLKHSSNSLFKRQTYSESEPLLGGGGGYRRQRYLCGERIQLTIYKRTQIFLFFYIVLYVGYLILGSICFQKLEIATEQAVRDEFRDVRKSFLEEHSDVKGKIDCQTKKPKLNHILLMIIFQSKLSLSEQIRINT